MTLHEHSGEPAVGDSGESVAAGGVAHGLGFGDGAYYGRLFIDGAQYNVGGQPEQFYRISGSVAGRAIFEKTWVISGLSNGAHVLEFRHMNTATSAITLQAHSMFTVTQVAAI